jgi:hypothetical protein
MCAPPVDHKLILRLALCVLVSQPLSAQRLESTRTTEYGPLRLSYDDLSKTVVKIHRLLQKANEGVDCERATEEVDINNGVVGVRIGQDFSSAAFSGAPEVAYWAEYRYDGCREAPISTVTLSLWDSSRTLEVEGRSADQVQELTGVITEDLTPFHCVLAGFGFRSAVCVVLYLAGMILLAVGLAGTIGHVPRLVGRCLGVVFMGLGLCLLLAVLACPWEKWFAGTAVYSGSTSFVERNAAEVTFLGAVATLLMPVLTGVLDAWRRKRRQGVGAPASITTETKPTRRRKK